MGTDKYGNFLTPMDAAMGRDNGPRAVLRDVQVDHGNDALVEAAIEEIERLRAENGRLRGGLTLRQPPVVPRPFKPEP